MLWQLHFQRRSDLNDTEMVAQGEAVDWETHDETLRLFNRVMDERRDDRNHDEWQWLILNEKDPRFVWAAAAAESEQT